MDFFNRKSEFFVREKMPKIFIDKLHKILIFNILFRRKNHIKNPVFYFDPKMLNFAQKLKKKRVLLYFIY